MEFKVPVGIKPVKSKSLNRFPANSSHASISNSSSPSNVPDMPLLFDCPSWASIPEVVDMEPHSLEVVKNGSIIDEIFLNLKPFYLFGRHPICDVVLQHESISRQHAAIVLKKDGTIYLYDLDSTYGTIINKNSPVIPKTFKLLSPGDSIQFGHSERRYFLNGGIETPVERIKSTNEIQKKTTNDQTSSKDEILQNENKKSSENDNQNSNPPEEFTKVIQSRKFKNQQINTIPESKKLENEEESDERSSESSEIDEDEDERCRNRAEMEMVAEHLGREAFEGNDEDDDFYDRTSKVDPDSIVFPDFGLPDTYETVRSKKIALKNMITRLNAEISTIEELIKVEEGKKSVTEDMDTLDAYMQSLSNKEVEQECKKRKLLEALQKELNKVEKIFDSLKPQNEKIHQPVLSNSVINKFSKDYYSFLLEKHRRTGLLSDLNRIKRNKTSEGDQVDSNDLYESRFLKSNKNYERHCYEKSKVESKENAEKSIEPEPEKSREEAQQFRGQVALKDTLETTETNNTTQAEKNKFIRPETDSNICNRDLNDGIHSKKSNELASTIDRQNNARIVLDSNDESEYEMWIAPVNQKGDGKTALNDKYGY